MTFQIWEYSDTGSRCLAERTKDEVQPEFHSMCIGQQMLLKGNLFIMRVK